jgi:hypothetical protein
MTKHLVPWAQSEDADETLRRLVRAGRNDGPSAASVRAAAPAIAALLAAGAATTIATAVGSGAAGAAGFGAKQSLSSALLVKWFGLGLLAGGSVVGLANVPRLFQPPTELAVRVSPPVAVRMPEQPMRRPQVVRAEPVALAGSAAMAPRAASRTDLAREIALLDRARAALAVGAPGRALEALDGLGDLPARALAPEATVLRVRALLAAGRDDQAREVVADFSRRAPGSPQLGVLRGLLERARAETPGGIDAGTSSE